MAANKTENLPDEPTEVYGFSLGADERFRVVGRLGAGGMGIVYEALDLERGMRVALKTLHHTNAQTLYRFKQEFRALTEIVHPRLVRLFELVADDERWFFTMELIDDGVSLLDWLADDTTSRLTPATLANAETIDSRPRRQHGSPVTEDTGLDESSRSPDSGIAPKRRPQREQDELSFTPPASYERLRAAFAQLAEGVHALHSAGRLHRDLKPENVFVRASSGAVVLLDFGLVAALEPPSARRSPSWPSPDLTPESRAAHDAAGQPAPHAYHATQTGLVAGTFAYMAPEQALAQPLTAAADWYAVGVMLYEALTGRLPHEGSGSQTLFQKQVGDPIAPILRVPGTPLDLSELCMDLLCREPSARPIGQEVVARLGGSLGEDDANESAHNVFVGRVQQLELLRRSFDASADGLTVAHVHGRSGAGKSSLLAQLVDELSTHPDTLVIAGRCFEQEFIPFKAVDSLMDALTRYLLRLSPLERMELLPPEARMLARVFPVLGRLFPAFRAEELASFDADRHAVRKLAFATMRELFHRLSKRVRLVLSIDDLQWGDVDSAALLSELMRPPDAPRLLLLLAYRSERRDQNPALTAIRAACSEACPAERLLEIDVGSLAADDARQLADQLLGDMHAPWTLDWIIEQAAGSAFLIHELARYLHAGGAPSGAEQLSLDDILWERVRALAPEPRALLSLVAVAGRPARLRYVQRAAQINALAPSVVSALCLARLLRTEGTGPSTALETFHDRVRESILARTPGEQLASHALALVQVLEQADEGDAETRASLYERAGETGRASAYYAAAVPSAVAALAFEHAERLVHKAIALAQSDEQIALAYEAAVHFFTDMARFDEAYAFTREGVAKLGVELPERFVPPLLLADLLTVQLGMVGKQPRDLLALRTMPKGRLQLAVRLANAGAKAAFQVRPELCVAVCTKLVRLCLEHGNSPDSAIGYMVFGAIFQGGILGRYTSGYEFGQLALALLDKYRNERQRAEVSFVVGYFGISWLRPATEAEALWQTAFEAGRASGDLFHMGCSTAGRMMSFAMRGVPLAQLEQECDALSLLLARHGLREPLAVVESVREVARSLRDPARAPLDGRDPRVDERTSSAALAAFGARHFAHCCLLLRAYTHYLWREHELAARALEQAASLAADSKGMLHSAEHVFVAALNDAAQPKISARRKLSLIQASLKLAYWARRCPDNFQHKAALISAEAWRVAGRPRQAQNKYAESAAAARKFGYVQVEALAHLLSARLHEPESEPRKLALQAARECYRRWGASALADWDRLLS